MKGETSKGSLREGDFGYRVGKKAHFTEKKKEIDIFSRGGAV